MLYKNEFQATNIGVYTLRTKSTNSGLVGFVYVKCTGLEADIMNYSIISRVQFFKGVAVGYNQNTMYLHLCGNEMPIAMPLSGHIVNIEIFVNELGEQVLLVYSRSTTGFNVDEIVIQQASNNNYKVKRLSGFTNTRDSIKYMSNIKDHLIVQSSQDAVEITEREKVIIGKSSFTLKTHGHVFTATELFGLETEIRGWFSTTRKPHENMYCASFNDDLEDYIVFFVYGGYKQFYKHYISKHTFTVAKYESVSFRDSKFAVNEENIVGVYMVNEYNATVSKSQKITRIVKIAFDGSRACVTSYDERTNSYNIYVLAGSDANYNNVEVVAEISSAKPFMPDKALEVVFPDGNAFMFLEQVGREQVHTYLARENQIIYEERFGYCKENVFFQLCLPQKVNLDSDFDDIKRKYANSTEVEDAYEDDEDDDMKLLDKEGSYGDSLDVDNTVLDDTDEDEESDNEDEDEDQEDKDQVENEDEDDQEGDNSEGGSRVDAVS